MSEIIEINKTNCILDEFDIKDIESAFEETYFFAEPEDYDKGRFLNLKNKYNKLLAKIKFINELAKTVKLMENGE